MNLLKKQLIFIFIVLGCLLVALPAWGQSKKLVFATVEWEPYYGPKLKNDGFITEITKAAFKHSGYDVEVKFMNWNRALERAKQGKFDGVMGAYYNDERAEVFEYSEPIGTADVVLFSQKGKNISYQSLEDLKPYKIGVLRGYANTEEFDKADFLKKEVAEKADLNIRKLARGRLDLFVGSKAVNLYLIQTKYPDFVGKFDVVEPPLSTNSLYNIISKKIKGSAQIKADFDKGLKAIQENGTYDEILKSHGF